MLGMVSLVGVGPGDPGLLTLRGARTIARADAVLYDALVHPAVLAHARGDCERVGVGKRKGYESATQDEINQMLLHRARQGKRVARLKGGDPMLFGRGAEECEFLAAHGVPFEVVPGVTAALGATAYAGIPLSHRDLSSSIALVTATESPGKTRSAHDWSLLATATQTLVFYMAMHRIEEEMSSLIAHGRSAETPAAVISWGTYPEQRTVTATVATIAAMCEAEGIGAPALVVVGEVVQARKALRWWDTRPLFGKRVLVTRAKSQSGGFVEALLDEGAAAIELPVLRFEDPTEAEPLARAVDAMLEDRYRAVAFTSHNGVERFFAALDARGLDARAIGRAKVAAIGPATAEALSARGVRADVVAKEYVGEGLATALGELLGESLRGARVLIARAEVARDALPRTLSAMGALPEVVAAYKTVAVSAEEAGGVRDELARGRIDVVTFTSSSTVSNLCDALGADARATLSRAVIASIGPITSETARARGLTVAVEAREYTTAGLLTALKAHFSTSGTP